MKSIKKNLAYNTIYQVMIMAIPLITRPYISRVLGADGIGVFGFANSVALYFVMFAHLGLNNYGNRSIARTRDDKKELSKTFCSIYALQLITASISLFIYILYIVFLCKNKAVGSIMMIYVISAGMDINWFFFGLEEFKLTAIRSIIVKLLSVVAIFVFVKTPSDVNIYCLIYVIGMILSQLILWIQIPKRIDFVKIKWVDIHKHIKPNLILFIPIIAVSLYKIMDKIMIGLIVNDTEVGYYESCEGILQIPIAIVNSLGAVMLPRISNLVAKNAEEETVKYLEKSFNVAMFLSASMSFGIMGVSKEFVPLFYGTGFEKCIVLFQILLPSCIFLAFANVVRTQYLIPHQKDREYIISVFIGAFVNLIINILLIPKMGSIGAAIGTVCAELAVCLSQSIVSRKEIMIEKFFFQNSPFVLSAVIMYLLLVNVSIDDIPSIVLMIIKIIVGIMVYFLCLNLFELINKKFFKEHYCDLKQYLFLLKKKKNTAQK